MNITGSFGASNTTASGIRLFMPASVIATGCFRAVSYSTHWLSGVDSSGDIARVTRLNFNADNSWTGATSSNGAHTHTLTVTKNANIYGNSLTVQPNALKIRVKCKAK